MSNKEEEKKDGEKIARDVYQESMQKSNLDADKKAGENYRKEILEMIEKNLNRTYFKETKLETFFEKCFALVEPEKIMEDPKFKEFIYYDTKYIV